MDLERLCRQYRSLLLDDVAPFWLRHGIDWDHGGVLSCMSDDGTILSGDKFLWSQARSVWPMADEADSISERETSVVGAK